MALAQNRVNKCHGSGITEEIASWTADVIELILADRFCNYERSLYKP